MRTNQPKLKKQDLSGDNLKNALWDTLQNVKAKRVTPAMANAVAAQSREIMRVVKAEIAIAALGGHKPSQAILSFTKN